MLLTNEWFCAMSWEVTNDYLDIRVNETQGNIIYNLYKRTSIPSKPPRFIQYTKWVIAVATQNRLGPLVHGPTRGKGKGLNLRHPRAFSLSLCKSRGWREPGWSLQSFLACVRSYTHTPLQILIAFNTIPLSNIIILMRQIRVLVCLTPWLTSLIQDKKIWLGMLLLYTVAYCV